MNGLSGMGPALQLALPGIVCYVGWWEHFCWCCFFLDMTTLWPEREREKWAYEREVGVAREREKWAYEKEVGVAREIQ